MAEDAVLAVHVAAGVAGLLVGAVALLGDRPQRPAGIATRAFRWVVLVVAASALVLIAFDVDGLWWLAPLAVGSYALAHVGWEARGRAPDPGWARRYAHGMGGAYIALVTATLVVSFEGTPVAWLAPTLAGLPLIEWRVRHLGGEAPAEALRAA